MGKPSGYPYKILKPKNVLKKIKRKPKPKELASCLPSCFQTLKRKFSL